MAGEREGGGFIGAGGREEDALDGEGRAHGLAVDAGEGDDGEAELVAGEVAGEPGAGDDERGAAAAKQVLDQGAVGVAGDDAAVDEVFCDHEGALGGGADEAELLIVGEQGAAEGEEDREVAVGVLGLVGERVDAGGEAEGGEGLEVAGDRGGVDEVGVDVEGDGLEGEGDGPGDAVLADGGEGVGGEVGVSRALAGEHGVGGAEEVALAVVADALVRVDEEVGAVAEGDRGGELAAEALVGDLQQLDLAAAGVGVALDELDEGGELGVAIGVPQAQRIVGVGAAGEDGDEEDDEANAEADAGTACGERVGLAGRHGDAG